MTPNLCTTIADLRTEAAPVYHHYPQQTSAQPAYIEMDEDGDVRVDWDGEIGGAVPMSVWHGRTMRWTIPNSLTGRALADFLQRADVQALLDRVAEGHSVAWDGHNHVGRLTDDGRDASDSLERLCARVWEESDYAQIRSAEEWVSVTPLDADGNRTGWRDADCASLRVEMYGGDVVLTRSTPDADIVALAARLQAQADDDNIVIIDDIADHLRALIAESICENEG